MAKEKSEVADPAPIQKPIERIYKGTGTLDHDLFKFEVSKMLRNVAWAEGEVEYVEIEHVHFFHTIDSDGRSQTYTTPTGNHFHKVRLIPNPQGGPPTALCDSGPLTMIKKKVKGKWVRVAEPTAGEDVHVHEVKYIRSDKIDVRKVHNTAVNIAAADAQKTAPIAGVVG